MEEPLLAPGRPQLSQSLPDILEPPLDALTNALKIVCEPCCRRLSANILIFCLG